MRLLLLVLLASVLIASCADHRVTDPKIIEGGGTFFSFSVPMETSYEIVIRTMTGYEIARLSGSAQAGLVMVVWNFRNNNGESVKEGIYRVELLAGDFYNVSKILYLSHDRDFRLWGTS